MSCSLTGVCRGLLLKTNPKRSLPLTFYVIKQGRMQILVRQANHPPSIHGPRLRPQPGHHQTPALPPSTLSLPPGRFSTTPLPIPLPTPLPTTMAAAAAATTATRTRRLLHQQGNPQRHRTPHPRGAAHLSRTLLRRHVQLRAVRPQAESPPTLSRLRWRRAYVFFKLFFFFSGAKPRVSRYLLREPGRVREPGRPYGGEDVQDGCHLCAAHRRVRSRDGLRARNG